MIDEETKQHIEEQIGKPDYFEDTPGVFSIAVQIVSGGTAGDIYTEYSTGLFALNVQYV